VVEQTRGDEILAEAVARSGRIFLGLLFFLPEPGEPPAPDGAAEPPAAGLARYGEAVSVAEPAPRRPPRAAAAGTSLPAIAAACGAGALNIVYDHGEVRRFTRCTSTAAALRRWAWPALGGGAPTLLRSATSGAHGDRPAAAPRRGPAGPPGAQRRPPRVRPRTCCQQAPREAPRQLVFVGFTDTPATRSPPVRHRVVASIRTLAHNLLEGCCGADRVPAGR
jgi:hypothetical protein